MFLSTNSLSIVYTFPGEYISIFLSYCGVQNATERDEKAWEKIQESQVKDYIYIYIYIYMGGGRERWIKVIKQRRIFFLCYIFFLLFSTSFDLRS